MSDSQPADDLVPSLFPCESRDAFSAYSCGSRPGLGVVPEKKPATTPTGDATLRKLSKSERNEWYARVLAA
jgi:hypothetical protein